MALHRGPKIVTDGLVLCLDAADRKSYPGSGTTWYDRSGNRNHGTIVGNPLYSNNNGGILTLNGDDYVNLNGGNAINNWNPDGINASTSYRSYTSANIWFRTSTVSTSGVNKMIFSDAALEYGFYHANSSFGINAYASRTTTIAANVWYNACITADIGRPTTGTYSQSGTTTVTCTTTYPHTFNNGDVVYVFVSSGLLSAGNYAVTVTGANTFTITSASAVTTSGAFYTSHNSNISYLTAYFNGTQLGTTASNNTQNGANDYPFNLGRDNNSATSYFSGDIAILQLYNKTLSATEVLQNFTAQRGRFGI